MRTFRGFIARKLPEVPTFKGKAETVEQKYEMDKAKAKRIQKHMKDLPIVLNHKDGVEKAVGRLCQSFVEGDWRVEFEIDENNLCGALACKLIDDGLFTGLSLMHGEEDERPVHIAICTNPARAGSVIDQPVLVSDSKPETYKHSASAGAACSAPITYICASLVDLHELKANMQASCYSTTTTRRTEWYDAKISSCISAKWTIRKLPHWWKQHGCNGKYQHQSANNQSRCVYP